jgi:hypothetical protein
MKYTSKNPNPKFLSRIFVLPFLRLVLEEEDEADYSVVFASVLVERENDRT